MPLSPYELDQRARIEAWKNPKPTIWGRITRTLNWPLDQAGNLVMETPGVGWVIAKSVDGLVDVSNDLAQWSVRPEAVFAEYRKAGHPSIVTHANIHSLNLREVDRTIGYLGLKYKSLALAEGGATGVLGLPGIPADIVALVVMNLRAIGEYATYCGFDVATQPERLFAMHVLGYASSPTDAAKAIAMASLVRLARDAAGKKTWKVIEQHAFGRIIRQIAKALGIRLTKAKLAQTVPAVGAVVGAGFNAYFTSKICTAANFLYRERFLAAKYGEDQISGERAAADSLDPG